MMACVVIIRITQPLLLVKFAGCVLLGQSRKLVIGRHDSQRFLHRLVLLRLGLACGGCLTGWLDTSISKWVNRDGGCVGCAREWRRGKGW